jgi:hypothetical protein
MLSGLQLEEVAADSVEGTVTRRTSWSAKTGATKERAMPSPTPGTDLRRNSGADEDWDRAATGPVGLEAVSGEPEEVGAEADGASATALPGKENGKRTDTLAIPAHR